MKILLLFFHPCYVIIPIILNILMYIVLCNYSKLNEKLEINNDSKDNITTDNNNASIEIKKMPDDK